MHCRSACGACCIAPSISSAIPGMPGGKPAGVRCIQLTSERKCALFGKPERPKVCLDFKADVAVCGRDRITALRLLGELEKQSSPTLS
ncbi:MAG: YkgJ family cysteine cluster protein [Gammaproteobacteria bacterium]|nr:MAG: YkgJ family cysteine cluster protein [Gammaproteobacteria bacterium]TDJ38043.1 MAG: YkgJ family cysteine cluster protein [Gammaproteobacteria bacterium]